MPETEAQDKEGSQDRQDSEQQVIDSFYFMYASNKFEKERS